MKLIGFFGYIFFLLIFEEGNLQGQSWLWGQQGYSSLVSSVYYSPVATDKFGNAYVTGTFSNTTVFGNIRLIGGSTNAYLAKFNSIGKIIWAKQAINSGNTSYSISESVTTDRYGNIYIAGNASGSVTFGRFSLTAADGYYTFLVKYDSNGNVLWAKQSSVISYNGVYNCSVVADASGNIFLTGLFDTITTFGVYTLTHVYLAFSNVFVVKYDALGNVLWAKQSTGMGLSNNYNYPFSSATDTMGNVYITSNFGNSITFDSYTLHSSKYYSVYLVKYSPQGTVLWARQSVNNGVNTLGSDYSLGYGYSVIADHSGNAYITGTFQDSIAFGSHRLSSPGGYSVFFTKYDLNGNVLWAQQSSSGWSGTGLAVDDSNHIYLSGQIIYYYLNSDELSFGGLSLNANPNSTASFIIKFDTDGNPYCGSVLNEVGENGENTGIASDITGSYIYMGGIFNSKEIICGPDTLGSQSGESNLLLARWKPCYGLQISPPMPIPVSTEENEPCHLFIPNAFSPNQNFNNVLYVRGACITSMKFLIFDRWGNKIFESENLNNGWDGTSKGQPVNTGTYVWYLKANLPDGTSVERKGNVTLVR